MSEQFTPNPPSAEQLLVDITHQVIELSSKVAALEARQQHYPLQQQSQQAAQGNLPSGVKVQTPSAFSVSADGDTIINLNKYMDNYFQLVGLNNDVQHAWFASTLLYAKSQSWFSTQSYDSAMLKWSALKHDLLAQF